VQRWAPVLERRLAGIPGVRIEDKGFSVAVHYRLSGERTQARAAIRSAARRIGLVRVIAGKQVLSLLPAGAPNKGTAFAHALARFECRAAVYVGDDATDTVYAGVQDAALFRSTDGGQSWEELPGLRGHQTAASWQPGAGGMCLHTILLDPANADRMYIAISAAGAFRTDDAGRTWEPINRGLTSQGIPDPKAEVGHCVHRIGMHPSRPGVLFMQKHWDVMHSDNAGESWKEVSGNLPTDFGFTLDVHAHQPDTVFVVPIKSDSEHYPPDGKLRVYRSRSGGNEWEALKKGLPQRNC